MESLSHEDRKFFVHLAMAIGGFIILIVAIVGLGLNVEIHHYPGVVNTPAENILCAVLVIGMGMSLFGSLRVWTRFMADESQEQQRSIQ